ncbi:hypothetical protein Tco_1578562 [Tanacetum coccineum]
MAQRLGLVCIKEPPDSLPSVAPTRHYSSLSPNNIHCPLVSQTAIPNCHSCNLGVVSTFLFLVFEEAFLRLLFEADQMVDDGLAISLPCYLVVQCDLVGSEAFDVVQYICEVLMFGTAGESSVAGTVGVVTIVGVYRPLRIHFRKASPFGLVSILYTFYYDSTSYEDSVHIRNSKNEAIRKEWVSDDEPEAPEEVPQFPEQAPPSPDYMPRPEHPPSPDYVPSPEYLEYLVPSNDEVPIEDQPLPDDASPTALSSGYVADFDPSEEDLEEDPTEYPADRGDDDDEEENEEEEHLALAESTTLPAIDPILSAKDTEAFETNESAPTPPLHRLRRAGISVRLLPPMTASIEPCIAKQAEHPMSREVGYGITDTWDELVDTIQEIAPTTLEGARQALTCMVTSHGTVIRAEHAELQAISSSNFKTHETHISDHRAPLGHIQTLEAREPARTDDPEDANSSA